MEKIISIIRNSGAAYLSTVNSEGYPETRALLNLPNPKKFKEIADKAMVVDGEKLVLYFTTNTSSRKIGQIRANSKASMYFCEPESFMGVCLIGEIEEVTDSGFKESLWQPGWTMYYHEGKTDPDYAVLRFTSESIHSWHSLGKHDFGRALPC